MKGKSAQRIRRNWRCFVNSMLGLMVSPVIGMASANAEDFGAIAGEFSVSSGTATYTIPIQMPDGVAGMQPEVSLNYSSQGGNGLLGLGWSLSGISAIHRCPATLAQDGIRGSVNLNESDKFCMDGQRLIAISGVDGDIGTEYRTEIDGFSKITSVNGSLKTGPESWIIKTKASHAIEFGAT